MEIKDPIHGAIEVSQGEVAILDSPEFQRLRLIKQLGFSEFSFPGAVHNRYIHSLGVSHLAGLAFDSIFKDFQFSKPGVKKRFRQCMRLAALLHDIGHGPLSHTTEEVMPPLADLNIKAYSQRNFRGQTQLMESKQTIANHEDYTVKIVTDSNLSRLIKDNFSDIDPHHVACLIDKTLVCEDDFFKDAGLDFRTILSQVVSSEMDCDRMDYLARDSYFCGTNYGVIEFSWLLPNMSYHIVEEELHLALNRRALYTFDDFLLSRHHMYLMVYFHHKSIIYEEMLYRFLTSPDCTYKLPADIDLYNRCTDYSLYEHMAESDNEWAKRITQRRPYKMVFEKHSTKESVRAQKMKKTLEGEGIHVITASSKVRLSKYHGGSPEDKAFQIYVVDQYDNSEKPITIDQCTQIFHKYEETRNIERLYVDRNLYDKGRKIILDKRL